MKKTAPGKNKPSKLLFKVKTEWDLSPFLKSVNDPEIAVIKRQLVATVSEFVKKWEGNQSYLLKPEKLLEALQDYERLVTEFAFGGRYGLYFDLRSYLDQADPTIKAEKSKARDFSEKELGKRTLFFANSLAKIAPEQQKMFLSDKRLANYRHFLEKQFASAKHLLSDPEEKLLMQMERPARENWIEMVEKFLTKEMREIEINGKKEKKNYEGLLTLSAEHPDKKMREKAFLLLNEIFEKFSETAEEELNTVLQFRKITDELRHFDRPDAASHLGDDMDSEVVDAMISAVTDNNKVAHRFYKLKAKLMGVPKIEFYDRVLPYGKMQKEYSFEEAVMVVDQVFGNLDPQFQKIFRNFLGAGQVDVFSKKGKGGGGFCAYLTKKFPVYILLNFEGRVNDVRTLAHEFGHAINDELMRGQTEVNFMTSLATAEVASTFTEDFTFSEIANSLSDEDGKLALMVMKLSSLMGSIFRQVACYQFEKDLHQGYRQAGYLSKEVIGELFLKRMSSYMGPAVRMNKGAEFWWVYWSHIRRYFYVYTYASGNLISASLQAMVKKDHREMEKVKEFLAAGGSDSPKNIFGKMGIDITDKKFWEKGIAEISQLLDETEKLAKKLGKI